MYGVVSLLDERHYTQVEQLWDEFQERFRVHGVSLTPIPHFSYQIAEKYQMDRLAGVLQTIAGQTPPFTVRTTGLGLFTGENLVLYIGIRLHEPLIQLQRQLWEALQGIAESPSSLYDPGNWQPHITLTHHDVDHDLLPRVIELLSQRDFRWEIAIDNLAVLGDTPNPDERAHGLLARVPLGGT